MTYDPSHRPAHRPTDTGATIADVDQKLAHESLTMLQVYADDLDQATVISTRWEALPDAQRFALRARNELSRRAAAKERATAKTDEAQRIAAEHAALAEVQIADLRAEMARVFPGTAAQFDAAFPEMLKQWQIDTARAAVGAALEQKRAELEGFV